MMMTSSGPARTNSRLLSRFAALATSAFLLLGGGLCASAFAQPSGPITFAFTVDIKGVDAPASNVFSVGDVIAGTYTFVYDGNPDGFYIGAITQAEITFQTAVWTNDASQQSNIIIRNNTPRDIYQLGILLNGIPTATGQSGQTLTPKSIDFFLADTSGTVFDDVALPLTPPDLSAFDQNLNQQFVLRFDDPVNFSDAVIIGQITSWTLLPDNEAPTSDAGEDVIVPVGETIELNGLGSTDDETPSASLIYSWTLVARPDGSGASLDDVSAAKPRFTPDIPGDYVSELFVTDGEGAASAVDSVTVTAEISPAFVYSATNTGSYSYVYERTSSLYAYSRTFDWTSVAALLDGNLSASKDIYSYSYDSSTGVRTNTRDSFLGYLTNSGFDSLVSSGAPAFEDFEFRWMSIYDTGGLNEDGKYYFYGSGASPTQGYDWGLFAHSNGQVERVLRPPIVADGGQTLLSGVSSVRGRYSGLFVGYTGNRETRERAGRTYSSYHQGIYRDLGTGVVKVVDNRDVAPNSGGQPFSSVYHPVLDAANDRVIFVGGWIDVFGQYQTDLYAALSDGSIQLLLALDGRTSWISNVVVADGIVYAGATVRNASGSYDSGIFTLSGGALEPEVTNNSGFGSLTVAECEDQSAEPGGDIRRKAVRRISVYVDTWNFNVTEGALVFAASFACSDPNGNRISKDGIFWKESGKIRRVLQSGDTVAHVTPSWTYLPRFAVESRKMAIETGMVTENTQTDTERRYEETGHLIQAAFDSDRDGVADNEDNCPARPNPDQTDVAPPNGIGDVCEDTDGDSVIDVVDNCPFVRNELQEDTDLDGVGNSCDLCPAIADDQSDFDNDGIGDACDPDVDGDLVANADDNCPSIFNDDQADLDADNVGDICDLDIDGDSIANRVDGYLDGTTFVDQRTVPSIRFSDQNLGGHSFGEVASLANLDVVIDDAEDPQVGLVISANGGSGKGKVIQCGLAGKEASLRFEQGSVALVTCGSVSVANLGFQTELVLDDDVVITLSAPDASVRVEDTETKKFTLTNESRAPVPVEMALGSGTVVTMPQDVTGTISEPSGGQYTISNDSVDGGLEPITVESGGVVVEYGAGDSGLPVRIDIKPGSDVNAINLGSNGNVPVAIFSSPGFDATSIDPLSVIMSSAPVRLKGKGTPMFSIEDVDLDGLPDMVVHIDTQSLELSLLSEKVKLKASTFGGLSVIGNDYVKVVQE